MHDARLKAHGHRRKSNGRELSSSLSSKGSPLFPKHLTDQVVFSAQVDVCALRRTQSRWRENNADQASLSGSCPSGPRLCSTLFSGPTSRWAPLARNLPRASLALRHQSRWTEDLPPTCRSCSAHRKNPRRVVFRRGPYNSSLDQAIRAGSPCACAP